MYECEKLLLTNICNCYLNDFEEYIIQVDIVHRIPGPNWEKIKGTSIDENSKYLFENAKIDELDTTCLCSILTNVQHLCDLRSPSFKNGQTKKYEKLVVDDEFLLIDLKPNDPESHELSLVRLYNSSC